MLQMALKTNTSDRGQFALSSTQTFQAELSKRARVKITQPFFTAMDHK